MSVRKDRFAKPSLGPNTLVARTPTRPKLTGFGTPATNRDPKFSIGTAQRRMSAFKVPNAHPKIDTTKKDVQQEMIMKIYYYVTETDPEEAMTVQQISSPSTADFKRVLDMILEDIAPEYEINKTKLVADVPKLFAGLGYPYPIKNSTLQTVGAQHSWHNLLHALCWLIDFVNMTMKIEEARSQIFLSGDNSDGNTLAFRYSWMQSRFQEHLSNKTSLNTTDIEAEEKGLRDWFENREDLGGQLKCAKATLESLRRENAEAERESGSDEKIKEDLAKVDDDIRKGISYTEMVEKAVASVENDKENIIFESEELQADVETLRQTVASKKQQLIDQEKGEYGIKEVEARRIMSEYNENREVLYQAQSELDTLSKETWRMQPQAHQVFTNLINRYREINSCLSDIGRQLFGEMSSQESLPKTTKELQNVINVDARAAVCNMIANIEAELNVLDKDCQALIARKKTSENRSRMEQERVDEQKKKKNRQSTARQRETEDQAKERHHLTSEIEKLMNEKECLESGKRDLNNIELELQTARRDVEEIKQRVSNQYLLFEDRVMNLIVEKLDELERKKALRKNIELLLESLSTENYDF